MTSPRRGAVGAATRAVLRDRSRTASITVGLATSAVAATLFLAACATPGPGNTNDPGGEGSLNTSSATPTPVTEYPNSPAAYAQAIVDEWTPPADLGALGELTTSEVQEQLIEIPMPLDMNWHYANCADSSGQWHCVFHNDHGDKLTLQISDALLGQAHAGVAVALDLTEYPDQAVAYGREYIDAWKDGNTYRMNRLATDTVVGFHEPKTKPANNYLACGEGAMGSTYVRIYGGGGPEYILQVSNMALGNPEAIVGYVSPPPVPAGCSVLIIPTIIFPLPTFTI
jgi:hypothetical protein